MSWDQEADRGLLSAFCAIYKPGTEDYKRLVDAMHSYGYGCTPKAVTYDFNRLIRRIDFDFDFCFSVLSRFFFFNSELDSALLTPGFTGNTFRSSAARREPALPRTRMAPLPQEAQSRRLRRSRPRRRTPRLEESASVPPRAVSWSTRKTTKTSRIRLRPSATPSPSRLASPLSRKSPSPPMTRSLRMSPRPSGKFYLICFSG